MYNFFFKIKNRLLFLKGKASDEFRIKREDGIKEGIKALYDVKKLHKDTLKRLSINDHPELAKHIMSIVILQRSLLLTDGFIDMIEKRNLLCAKPLIRLQIDNAMKLNAVNEVADPEEFVYHLVSGWRIDKYRSKDGIPLADFYLKDCLNDRYPWVADMYQELSSFIHLSDKHFIIPSFQIQNRVFRWGIVDDEEQKTWSDAQVHEAIGQYMMVTKAIFELATEGEKAEAASMATA